MEKDPVAMVTGASSGIGAATARLFASHGYRTVLAARRFQRLEALAEEIQAAGGQSIAIETDVSQWSSIQALARETLDRFGQVDVLVNNAGLGRIGWLEELDPIEDIAAQIQVNLIGLIQLSHTILPHMIARRQGHIINMISLAGLVATPTYSIYAASKFGVRGFSNALRREVGVWGIQVSAIYPGAVTTEFTEHAGIHRKTGITTPKSLRLSAEEVAQAIYGLVNRPRRSLVIPRKMIWLVWLAQVLPGFADWFIQRRFVFPERKP